MTPLAVPEAFRDGCDDAGLQPAGGRVLVGMSGGCDSMVLGHLLLKAGFDIEVAHVNYGLRPESDAEEALVRQWCHRNDLAFHVRGPSDVHAPASGVQAWARTERYTYFEQVAESIGATAVAVAHHADDQLETMLLNLERGTGPGGLVGMVPSRRLSRESSIRLARPLLRIAGDAVRSYAMDENLDWLEDASNRREEYARNAIRSELASMGTEDVRALREAAIGLSERMRALRSRLREALGGDARLLFEDLDRLPAWMREWCVMEWLTLHAPAMPRRRSMAREILSLRALQTGRRVEYAPYVVWRERDGLHITRTRTHAAGVIHVPIPSEGVSESVPFDGGRLVVDLVRRPVRVGATRGANTVVLDASAFNKELRLRSWKAGDRFRPPGLKGHKKIKAFLTDGKVAPSVRARVPVLVDDDGILWVVGQEIDVRADVAPGTSRGLRMEWIPDIGDGG